jgi:hypothetical protein
MALNPFMSIDYRMPSNRTLKLAQVNAIVYLDNHVRTVQERRLEDIEQLCENEIFGDENMPHVPPLNAQLPLINARMTNKMVHVSLSQISLKENSLKKFLYIFNFVKFKEIL